MTERFIQAKPRTLFINEIFYSIQGESSYAGKPCIFVRLAYCDVRCSYCDTDYAFSHGSEMLIDTVLGSVEKYGCKLVEVTGGEPLLQTNVHELLSSLCDRGYEVLLETGGSLDIGKTDKRVKRIVDFKCPSSKAANMNFWDNVHYLREGDEAKFVIGDREDYNWAKKVIDEYKIIQKCPVLMSVVYGRLEPSRLAEWILEDNLNVRFQLQTHKYIWHNQARGV